MPIARRTSEHRSAARNQSLGPRVREARLAELHKAGVRLKRSRMADLIVRRSRPIPGSFVCTSAGRPPPVCVSARGHRPRGRGDRRRGQVRRCAERRGGMARSQVLRGEARYLGEALRLALRFRFVDPYGSGSWTGRFSNRRSAERARPTDSHPGGVGRSPRGEPAGCRGVRATPDRPTRARCERGRWPASSLHQTPRHPQASWTDGGQTPYRVGGADSCNCANARR